MDTSHPVFVGIDGGKGLRAAVVKVFDHPLIALARTLRSTNSIESMIWIARNHSCNVKNWQDPTMAAALVRRRDARSGQAVPPRQWHLHLPAHRLALDEYVPHRRSVRSVNEERDNFRT